MPRPAATPSIDQIVQAAVADVVVRASAAIAQAVANIAAQELEKSLAVTTFPKLARRAVKGTGSRPRVEVTKWVPDKRARRLPTFVIEATGLKTKKAVVAKFGDNALFEKGKPLPKTVKAA